MVSLRFSTRDTAPKLAIFDRPLLTGTGVFTPMHREKTCFEWIGGASPNRAWTATASCLRETEILANFFGAGQPLSPAAHTVPSACRPAWSPGSCGAAHSGTALPAPPGFSPFLAALVGLSF